MAVTGDKDRFLQSLTYGTCDHICDLEISFGQCNNCLKRQQLCITAAANLYYTETEFRMLCRDCFNAFNAKVQQVWDRAPALLHDHEKQWDDAELKRQAVLKQNATNLELYEKEYQAWKETGADGGRVFCSKVPLQPKLLAQAFGSKLC